MTESQIISPTSSRLATLRADLLASVVVFLVALPLCMGVAIASGAPVAAGLITGIIGGIVAGALSGCPLGVSGPAAGLTVIVYEIIERLGFEQLGLVVLVAGGLQLAAGAARLGQWFRAVSPAVIKGMLAGIGFLILASQFHVMLDAKPPGNGAENLLAIPEAITRALQPISIADRATRASQLAALQTSRELLTQQITLRKLAAEASTEADRIALEPQQSALHARVAAWAGQVEAVTNNAGTRTDAHAALTAQQSAIAALATAQIDPIAAGMDTAVATLTRAQLQLTQPNLAGALGLLTIVVIILWQELAPKTLKAIPPALAAVIVTATVASSLALPVFYVNVPSQLWNDIHWPTSALLQSAPWKLVLQYGLLTAIVASAETLLCAAAVDQMQTGPRTKYDQELMSQGFGNMLCGLVGALPMTGVIVRSSANVQAGGKTRLSTMLHGLWLLVFVSGMAALLRQIPTSCLAAILVYTGYKLIDVKAIRELRDFGWGEVAIYATTITVIVFEDLLSGVLVGIALSAIKLLYTFSHLKCDLKTDAATSSARLHLRGAATFVRLPYLAAELERVPTGYELHVDFSELDYIDHACLELLMSWGAGHQATGGQLVIDWESLHGRFRRDHLTAKPLQ
jgi:MFS superfamily sulfate permease-like transporter